MQPAPTTASPELAAWTLAEMPRLLDTDQRESVRGRSALLARDAERPEVAYSRGYLAARAGAIDDATSALVTAQMRVGPEDRGLAARIALELGYLYLTRGADQTARAVASWGEGIAGHDAADVAHLRALLANSAGDYQSARAEYRVAIAGAAAALSPFTYAVALTNLAVALSHRDPAESVELARLSLRTMAAARLHPAIAPAAENALGYALICLGDLSGAAVELERARSDAARTGNATIERFAEFNLSIVDELNGDLDGAATRLTRVRHADRAGGHELHHWAALRLAWLHALAGDTGSAAAAVERLRSTPRTTDLDNAVLQLQAVVHVLTHQYGDARAIMQRQISTWASNGDDLNQFVAGLWLAQIEVRSGRERAARAALGRAVELGRDRGFCLSPSWWASSIVDAARDLATPSTAAFVRSLRAPRPAHDAREAMPAVELRRDGVVLVDGAALDADIWRAGRSGSGVLRRFFAALARAYPRAIERDALTDMLWPESDGDRALANLYGATHDLRRVLASVPGVDLIASDGLYELRCARNVAVTAAGA